MSFVIVPLRAIHILPKGSVSDYIAGR